MNAVTTPADKRKSFAIAVVIYAIIILILFFIRFWPPSNTTEILLAAGGGGGGVTVNFGDSEVGSGKDFKSEVLNVKTETKQVVAQTQPEEKLIAQENATEDNDVVIAKKTIVKKPKEEIIKKETKLVEVKPKVTKNTNDALANILNGNNKGGDGDDNASGNKGKTNGSLNSNDYYGNGGSGGGTGGGNGTGTGTGTGSGTGPGSGGGSGGGYGYSLGGRKALNKPQPRYTCNESGKVVVKVSVDRNGNTISAVPGVKGTTNTANCLLDQAKIAAMNTKWQPSENAPEKQVGEIVYNFSLN
jgi:hypothetical protein